MNTNTNTKDKNYRHLANGIYEKEGKKYLKAGNSYKKGNRNGEGEPIFIELPKDNLEGKISVPSL